MEINYQDLTDNINDGLYIVDTTRKIVYWNRAAEDITGFIADEVVGSYCHENILMHINKDGCQLCKGVCPLSKTMEDSFSRKGKLFLHHKDGYRIPVWTKTVVLHNQAGEVVGGAEIFTDMRDRHAYNRHIHELEKLAFLDHLTEVGNRRYVEIELESRLAELKRHQLAFGILFVDIDHFKEFNDTYGHDVGDKVLKMVAKTLHSNLRPFDLIGRWGGEEFICVIRNVDNDELEFLGDRLRVLVRNSHFRGDSTSDKLTVSIGATIALEDDTLHTLVRRADDLLYKCKSNGRDCLFGDHRR